MHDCRVCQYSSESAGDSSSDSNSDDADNRTLPGSAIRAKKSAARQLTEAKMQDERLVSLWITVHLWHFLLPALLCEVPPHHSSLVAISEPGCSVCSSHICNLFL